MAIIANNIRISLSSTITQNQSFDLTSLFLRGPFLSEDSFFRGDATTNLDPFLFNLPTFDNQTLSLIIEDDLSASAGENFSIILWHLTTQTDGSTALGDYFTIEIDVIDESTLGNTIDNITVRENQLGQIFDPDDVDFGLTNPATSYIIADGGDYVTLNNFNKVILNPSFDPDDDDITNFTFTITAIAGDDIRDHTVTVNIDRVDDTAPEIVTNQIDVFSHHLTTDIIITEDMINYTDEDIDQTAGGVTYLTAGDPPSGASFFIYVSEFSTTKIYNPASFTHQNILDGLVGIEFTDLSDIDGLSLLVSDGFNVSETAVSIDFRREAVVDDADQSNTIDHSTQTESYFVNGGWP